MKKRKEIIIETHQAQIIRRHKLGTTAWCSGCPARIRIIAPQEAAALAQVTTLTIFNAGPAGVGLQITTGNFQKGPRTCDDESLSL